MTYERLAEGPVLGGDVLADGKILGFAYVAKAEPGADCDRLLLAGEESLTQPPDRMVPDTAQTVTAFAKAPPLRLDAGHQHQAADVSAGLADLVARTLSWPGTDWSGVAGPLIEQLSASGHLVWLAGGVVRDLLVGADSAKINDLDLAGTVPPGRFTELARKVRRRLGMEYRVKVSKDSLVCSAEPPFPGDRLYEYRTLKLDGLQFPASASDMAVDARCRDLTVNSLYYDPVCDVLIDPTGRALSDLTAEPRVLASLNESADAAVQASIVMRSIKFVVRWQDTVTVDLSELSAWIGRLPAKWAERVTDVAWPRLVRDHLKAMGDIPLERRRAAAKELGPAAVDLLEEILGRVG